MPEPTTFGRKPAPGLAKPPDPPDAHALSPQAEAFRKTLKSDRTADPSDFAHWRRTQQGRRAVFWIASIALLAPGVISFVVDMPFSLSLGLEVLGIAGNWWLRRERKRHLKEIAAWDA
ncbi:MAG TPA: hypothetical protein VGL73_16570 [Caulobacteraceae bacterium]